MQIRRCFVIVFCACLATATALGQTVTARKAIPNGGRDGMGYRGDGSWVAWDSNPPVRWDEKTGENILWQTRLPSWSLSSPIVLGERVFVMSEISRDTDFPELVCLSAKTGKLLWQKPIDAIDLMDASKVDVRKVRQAWSEFHALDRLMYTMSYRRRQAKDPNEFRKELAGKGLVAARKGCRGIATKVPGRPFRIAKVFNRAGLYFDVWHWSGMAMIGYGYPTPVTDGESIYVATGNHAFACFDPNGQMRWAKFYPGQGTSNAGYGGNDFCKQARSPIVYGDLLISDVGNLVRAIDKNTGELLWSHEKYSGHYPITSPVILTTGDTDVLLTFGPHAFRLPDGRELKIEGWGNQGATMLVKYDEPDVVFFTGGGEHGGWINKGRTKNPPPSAVRFRVEEDKLVAKVLWATLDGETIRQHAGIVYHDGKLYHSRGVIVDADTGKILNGTHRKRHPKKPYAAPRTRHMLWVAGGHVYGIDQRGGGRRSKEPSRGVCEVYDLTGEKTATSTLSVPKAEGKHREKIIEKCGNESWGFSYGCPFAILGDRIYIRSNDLLTCIGKTGKGSK